jgi:YfiR/HmsC-like
MREMPLIRVRLSTLAVVLVLLFLGQSLSPAQTMSEYQVKAAYLYNFAKFVEWPGGAFSSPTAPLQFCVLNDQAFESELNRLVTGKAIAGRPANVTSVRNAEESRRCHILFINSSQRGQVRHVLEVLRDTSVLTVGETQGFVEEGGIINFVLQDDRVQFQVNHKAAAQAALHISSRLLSVAKLVIE